MKRKQFEKLLIEARESKGGKNEENHIELRKVVGMETKLKKEDDKKRYAKKLEYCKEVFKVCNQIIDDGIYMKIREVLDSSEIKIYHGRWGHDNLPHDNGCWSEVALTLERKIIYSPRYKWHGCNKPMTMYSKPEDMAKDLTFEYLKKLYKHITSEDLFTQLGGEIARRTNQDEPLKNRL